MDNKYKIFDSHAHYDDDSFDGDREETFRLLKEEGVIGILNCSTSYESVFVTDKLTKEWDFIYGAVGIHPENAIDLNEERIEEFKEIIKANNKIVAIGEIGLDYYWDENPPKEVQRDVFRKQMKLAEELDLPVVIHDRDAHKDTLDIMMEFPKVKGVVHCFSGSVEFAKECVKLGYFIGITGVVTFKNAKKIEKVVAEIPIERLLVETDCPYMTPEPNRGKRNQSNYIKYIIEKIADIRKVDSLELNRVLNDNLNKFIKIKK